MYTIIYEATDVWRFDDDVWHDIIAVWCNPVYDVDAESTTEYMIHAGPLSNNGCAVNMDSEYMDLSDAAGASDILSSNSLHRHWSGQPNRQKPEYQRSKHIDVRYHFVRYHFVKHIPVEAQIADILKKPLQAPFPCAKLHPLIRSFSAAQAQPVQLRFPFIQIIINQLINRSIIQSRRFFPRSTLWRFQSRLFPHTAYTSISESWVDTSNHRQTDPINLKPQIVNRSLLSFNQLNPISFNLLRLDSIYYSSIGRFSVDASPAGPVLLEHFPSGNFPPHIRIPFDIVKTLTLLNCQSCIFSKGGMFE